MCLLFFNINDDCRNDEFRLILVNNRDELWQRPTKPADFWTSNHSCIGGLDQEPGREGGTWLGANRFGRIGCLVNIAGQQDPTKKQRGFLVTDFLTSAERVGQYASTVSSERDDYNGFILTLIELGQTKSSVVRVTNDRLADKAVKVTNPSPEDIFSAGNSPVEFPWCKVSEGRQQFAEIAQAHRTVSQKDQLTKGLLDMMSSRRRYTPDPQLQKQGVESGWSQEKINAMSAMFVWMTAEQYGTRTTTVLLIDGKGNCDYTERTLETPICEENPEWLTSHYRFKLGFDDCACQL